MSDIPSNREMRQIFFEVTGKLSAGRFSEYESFVDGWKSCHAQSQQEVTQLRSEVATMHKQMSGLWSIVSDYLIFSAKSTDLHEAYDKAISILSNTQATAQAYEAELREISEAPVVAVVYEVYVCPRADGKYRATVISDERLSQGAELFISPTIKE